MKRQSTATILATLAGGLLLAAAPAQAGTGYVWPGTPTTNSASTLFVSDYDYLVAKAPAPTGAVVKADTPLEGALRLNSKGYVQYALSSRVARVSVAAQAAPCLNPADSSEWPTITIGVRNGATGEIQAAWRQVSTTSGYRTYPFTLPRPVPSSKTPNSVIVSYANDYDRPTCDRSVALSLISFTQD